MATTQPTTAASDNEDAATVAADTAPRGPWRINQVYWFCLGWIALWFVLRAAGVDRNAAPVYVGPFVVILVLAVVNLSLRTWVARLRDRHPEGLPAPLYLGLGWVFTLADLLLVAGGLRATGGLNGSLWIVFFLLVVAETVLARAPELRLIHAGVAVALILGTVPLPPASIDGAYLLEISTRLAFLVAVSSVNWRLRDTAARRNAELGALRSELQLAGERTNLSREIHDGVGNALAASVLRLEVAARIAEKQGEDSEQIALLREEAQALRHALNSVRDWTFFTRPWPSGVGNESNTGGSDAPPSVRIAEEIARLSRRTGLAMAITGAEELDRLSPGGRLTVLRILQEALTNAAKYAEGATVARASIVRDGATALAVTITDDGCGFEGGAAQGGAPGIGLSSMRERAESAGGSLTITSAPGGGVTVTARIPV